MPSPASLHLPELLADILKRFCGHSRTNFKAFCRRRETASLVCREWAYSVNQNPLLWKYLVIYYELEPAVLAIWLDRANEALVDVFIRYQGPGPTWQLLTFAACAKSARVIRILAEKASQLQSLEIYAEDIACARIFTDFIANHAFPEMQSLAVCAWTPLAQLPFAVSQRSLPRMIDGHLPVLHELTLFSAQISVAQAQRLDNLRFLRLGGMASHCSYSWEVLGSIFRCATGLRKLSLSSVECHDIPQDRSLQLLLPALEELDIAFLGRTEVARLVASFRMPSLTTLNLTCDHGRDIANAAMCLAEDDIFYAVETLTIVGIGVCSPGDVEADIIRLYRSMPKMRLLDLKSAHPVFFTALIMADREDFITGDLPTSVTQLERIEVSVVPSVCIRAFVVMRFTHPRCVLRDVYFDATEVERCSEGTYEDDMEYLQSKVYMADFNQED
ncbi:hypothetical protein B0H11DRAFT_2237544 [Mycena galericulata]|nr:hypothetical protein B0H11DRAFT_2237544 [Mycena galericulata]